MKKAGIKVTATLSGVLMLIVLFGSMFVSAQTPSQDRQPGQGDMWNPNWMQRDMWGPDQKGQEMRKRMARHWTFMHRSIPIEYSGARNPFSIDVVTISTGRALYQANCASCHGTTGMGDGEMANALNPSPALLAYMIQMPMAVDEYMLWSISDGGVAFDTAMPAFKEILTQDEIWKIVSYMRAGFPQETEQQ
ncbi:MAG: c-type cytochrome [Gammaproteobacteria bacterium]